MSWQGDYRKDVREVGAEARWTFFRVFRSVLVPIGLFIGLLSAGCWFIGIGTGVVGKVVNPAAIIGNYEWYAQQVKDIKAIEGQLADAAESAARFKTDSGDPSGWKFDQRGEYARLNSNVTGLAQSRRKLIEDYNAKSGMITRNLWKHPSLPQHIEE